MINTNIKCPSCHTSFNIEENAYAEIRAQIKDIEIESSVSSGMVVEIIFVKSDGVPHAHHDCHRPNSGNKI